MLKQDVLLSISLPLLYFTQLMAEAAHGAPLPTFPQTIESYQTLKLVITFSFNPQHSPTHSACVIVESL